MDLYEELIEDRGGLLVIELVVFECNVDTRLDCNIELGNLVRCEEEDTFIIFQNTEEN
jgi:hypothetical protein